MENGSVVIVITRLRGRLKMYIEDILDILTNIENFCKSIADDSESNSAITLVKMCKQKVINLGRE